MAEQPNVSRRRLMYSYFYKGKSAEETHKLICEQFGDSFVPLCICNMWFNKFKADVDFTSAGATMSELEALLAENPNQTQEALANQLRISQTIVSRYLRQRELEKRDDKQVDTVALVKKLFNYFTQGQSLTEAQKLICDEFVGDAVSLSCEIWYNRFNLGDKDISKHRIKFEEFKALHEQNLLDNLTREECAHKLGVALSTLKKYFKKINQEDENKQMDTGQLVIKLFDYFKHGQSVTEAHKLICEEFGNSVTLIYCEIWYNRFNLGDEDISKHRIKFEEFKALYEQNQLDNLTRNQCAETLRVDVSTVYRYLTKIKEEEENKQVNTAACSNLGYGQ